MRKEEKGDNDDARGRLRKYWSSKYAFLKVNCDNEWKQKCLWILQIISFKKIDKSIKENKKKYLSNLE